MKTSAEEIRSAWNANRGDLPECLGLDFANRRQRAESLASRFDLPTIVRAIKRVAGSRFCNGLVPTKEAPEGFRANFGWFLNEGNVERALEGQFDNTEPTPPETSSPKDLSYWEQPIEEITFTQDEFDRCQIAGKVQLMHERLTHRRSWSKERKATGFFEGLYDGVDDFAQEWINSGGKHPYGTDEQVRIATEQVMEARAKGELPKTWAEFRRPLSSDYELAVFSVKNPLKNLPAKPRCGFREFIRLKERARRELGL